MTDEEVAKALKDMNKDAVLFLRAGEFEKAYGKFEEYLNKVMEFKFYDHAAKARVNMANTLYVMGRYKESLECLSSSLKYFEEKKAVDLLNENRIVEGNLYLKLNETEKLIELSSKMIKSTHSDRIKSIAYMFGVYADEKKGKVSIDSINKAVSYAERSNDKNVLKQVLNLRAEYYEKTNRPLYATLDRDRIKKL